MLKLNLDRSSQSNTIDAKGSHSLEAKSSHSLEAKSSHSLEAKKGHSLAMIWIYHKVNENHASKVLRVMQ